MRQLILTIVTAIKTKVVSNSSLIAFRVLFGLLLFFSTLRFLLKGWVQDFYIEPHFHFSYQYFPFVKALNSTAMYCLFGLLLLFSIMITTGWFYRISTLCFFLIFTYIELIDKTFYLNHYYAVSIITFIMIFLPLSNNQAKLFNSLKTNQLTEKNQIDSLYIYILRLQVGLIYFFAGLAKINYDWLLNAQPMKIWLDARTNIPIIGNLLDQSLTAYFMSWTGMIYDLTIPFLLINKKTRKIAFISVVIFHLSTHFLFQIGIFPWLMIISATVFFEPDWLNKFIEDPSNSFKNLFRNINPFKSSVDQEDNLKTGQEVKYIYLTGNSKIKSVFLGIFFLTQIILPIRHYFYDGNFFWTEKGFRFAWHVMLMEKTGYIEFNIKDKDTNKSWLISPKEYLSPLQEKMMATQPDMILQFAHFLGDIYKNKGHKNIEIKVYSYVSLNGRPSRAYIYPDLNLLDYDENSDVNSFLIPF